MRQKTIKTIFFLILLAPFIVSFVALNLRKKQIKKEVKHFLMHSVEKKDLYYLKFSKRDIQEKLRWEKDHEFEYQGKMYDIVETYKEQDSIAYWCWLDREETALNKKLHRLTHFNFSGDNQKKNCEGSLVYLIESQYFPPSNKFSFIRTVQRKKDNFYWDGKLLERNDNPLSPPPDLL